MHLCFLNIIWSQSVAREWQVCPAHAPTPAPALEDLGPDFDNASISLQSVGLCP